MTVTERGGMKRMAAGSFKSKCLAVMDEVHAKCETVIITKHGKPVAKLVPVNAEKDEIYDFLAAKVRSSEISLLRRCPTKGGVHSSESPTLR